MEKNTSPKGAVCQLYNAGGELVVTAQLPVGTNYATAIHRCRRRARANLVFKRNHAQWLGKKPLPACVADRIITFRRLCLSTPFARALLDERWDWRAVLEAAVEVMEAPAELEELQWEDLIRGGYIKDPIFGLVGEHHLVFVVFGKSEKHDHFAARALVDFRKTLGIDDGRSLTENDWWSKSGKPAAGGEGLHHDFGFNITGPY